MYVAHDPDLRSTGLWASTARKQKITVLQKMGCEREKGFVSAEENARFYLSMTNDDVAEITKVRECF